MFFKEAALPIWRPHSSRYVFKAVTPICRSNSLLSARAMRAKKNKKHVPLTMACCPVIDRSFLFEIIINYINIMYYNYFTYTPWCKYEYNYNPNVQPHEYQSWVSSNIFPCIAPVLQCIIWHVSKLYVIALLYFQLPVATDSTDDLRVLIVIIFLKNVSLV